MLMKGHRDALYFWNGADRLREHGAGILLRELDEQPIHLLPRRAGAVLNGSKDAASVCTKVNASGFSRAERRKWSDGI